MWPFSWLTKRWALSRYVGRLGKLLVERYGREADYSPARVRATIASAGLNPKYLPYAAAMFAAENDFVDWMLSLERRPQPGEYRAEAGDHPYRSLLERPSESEPAPTKPRAVYTRLYARLRVEAARYNRGSMLFLPDEPRYEEQWSPIPNERATGTKAMFF